MAKRWIRKSTLVSWADAIREKKGTTEKIPGKDIASEILSLGAVPSTITFTIDETTYEAKYGMTWGDWQASTYNTVGVDENIMLNGMFIVPSDSNYFVSSTYVIVSGHAYKTSVNASGGSN